MTLLNFKLALGVLLGLTTAGAIAYSTGRPGGEEPRKAAEPGAPAPAARVVRVPSPQEGILLAVGTEVEKDEPGKVFKVKVGNSVHTYRRLREGDKVKEGQMLAQLDHRLASNELEIKKAKLGQAEAEYQAARATAVEAQNRLDRLKQLLARGVVAQEEYQATLLNRDKYRLEEAAKREGVRAAQLDLERARTTLEMYTIRSPVSGVIQRIQHHRGEAVRRLETLFEIRVAEGQE